jgi:hypothetical protein
MAVHGGARTIISMIMTQHRAVQLVLNIPPVRDRVFAEIHPQNPERLWIVKRSPPPCVLGDRKSSGMCHSLVQRP